MARRLVMALGDLVEEIDSLVSAPPAIELHLPAASFQVVADELESAYGLSAVKRTADALSVGRVRVVNAG